MNKICLYALFEGDIIAGVPIAECRARDRVRNLANFENALICGGGKVQVEEDVQSLATFGADTDVDVVRMRLHDNLNQVTDLSFIDADKETQVNAAVFEFIIPTGVDVVNGLTE